MLSRNQERAVVIDGRFAGLPEIAHGGYVAGVLAAAVGGGGAQVRLRRPVPTGRRLTLTRAGGAPAELWDGEAILAEAAPAALSLYVPPPVTLAEAQAASRRFPGLGGHLFPGCFGCGTERHAGDGLRIFPGPVAGRRLVAAPWVPDPGAADAAGRMPGELVWAALDCPQLWSLIVHLPAATPDLVVTAELATRLERPVVAGEPHVLIAWPIGGDGRARLAGAALIGPGGEVCAVGRQTAAIAGWGVPLGRARWRTGQNAIHTRRQQ